MNVKEMLRGGQRHPKADLLVSVSVAMAVWKAWLGFSEVIPCRHDLDNILTVLVAAGFAGCILLQGNNWKTLLAYGAGAVVALLSAMQSEQMVVLFTVLACLALKDCDMDRVLKEMLGWMLVFFLVNTVFALKARYMDESTTAIYHGANLTLGFIYKNMLGLYLFQMAILWMWIRFDTCKVWDILGLLALSWVIAEYPHCRTAGYLLAVCTLVLAVIRLCGKERLAPVITAVAAVITPAMAAMTVVLGLLYEAGNALARKIDSIVTLRFYLMATHLKYADITFFGNPIKDLPERFPDVWLIGTLDNIYSFAIFNMGWLWLVVLSAGMFLLARRKDPRINCFIIVWALYGITEIHGTNGFYLFPILLLSLLLSGKEKRN